MANKPPLFAGIDIGSNSFRLLIAKVKNNKVIALHKQLDTVRLGRGLADTGKLSPEALALAFQVFDDYRTTMDRYQPAAIRACGTAALRLASNSDFFLDQSTKILAATLEVISGEAEALLAQRGAMSLLPKLSNKGVLLVDAGGGSTELIYTTNTGKQNCVVSVPIGAVNLTETFLRNPRTTPDEFAQMAVQIESQLIPFWQALRIQGETITKQPLVVIATGGTATALAALALKLNSYDSALIQGYVLSKTILQNLINMLFDIKPAERNRLPGLDRQRGEIILAGAAILNTILKLSKVTSITVSDAGLIEGILLSAADNWKNVFTKRQKSHIS